MSVVTIQFGQCGNQLGHAFFDTVMDEIHASGTTHQDVFFRTNPHEEDQTTPPISRALLVDMEPKVVSHCIASAQTSNKWKYDKRRVCTRQSGSGNNWAYGYNVHGRIVCDDILDLVRKEVELCDYFGGFLAFQSVAGGTGSGLGSYIAEQLAVHYPKAHFLNTVVWPFKSGEVIVQNYNSLLTMASLMEASNGIILFENDAANSICKKLLNVPNPSFRDINVVLAKQLAMVLLPSAAASELTPYDHTRTIRLMGNLVDHLCAHPGYKMLNIKAIPQMPQRSKAFASHRWSGLLKHLHQMHIADSALEEGIDWSVTAESSRNRSVASALFYRGPKADGLDWSAFSDPRLYARWHSDPFRAFYQPCSFNRYDKCAALLSNSQAVVEPIKSVFAKADGMFDTGAYMHQYEAKGIERSHFEEAFLRIEQVILNYETL